MQSLDETFTERFNRLTTHLRDVEIATITGLSETAIRQLRSGDTQSMKLASGLLLARAIGVTPWYLAFGREELRRRR